MLVTVFSSAGVTPSTEIFIPPSNGLQSSNEAVRLKVFAWLDVLASYDQ